MNLEEKQHHAVLAQQALDNPVFAQSLVEIKADLFNEWTNTKWFQIKKREKIWGMMKAASEMEKSIKQRINSGNLASQVADRQARLKKVK